MNPIQKFVQCIRLRKVLQKEFCPFLNKESSSTDTKGYLIFRENWGLMKKLPSFTETIKTKIKV